MNICVSFRNYMLKIALVEYPNIECRNPAKIYRVTSVLAPTDLRRKSLNFHVMIMYRSNKFQKFVT